MHFMKYVRWRGEKFGAVIFDTLSEKVYVTNKMGNEILRLVIDGLNTSEIATCLQEEYVGDPSRIKSDVTAFVNELRSAGLLAVGAEEQP